MKKEGNSGLDLALHSLLELLHIDEPGFWEPDLKGIPLQDLHVLVAIDAGDGRDVKDIRSRFGIPNSTMTGVLDRLERGGFLRRSIDPRDRRSFELLITDAGRSLVAAHDRGHAALISQIARQLDENELALLCALLEKIGRGMWKEN